MADKDPLESQKNDLMNELEPILAVIFARYIRDYKVSLRERSQIPTEKFLSDMQFSLERHYRRSFNRVRAYAIEGFDPANSDAFAEEWFVNEFDRWAKTTAAARALLITNTTEIQGQRARAQAELGALEQDDLLSPRSLAVAAAAILKRELDIRKKTIAETETQTAVETTKFLRGESIAKSPTLRNTYAVFKTWNSLLDGRERPTHFTADGQERPQAVPFSVGGASLMYPKDPAGPAKEIINCRCFITTRVVRLEE